MKMDQDGVSAQAGALTAQVAQSNDTSKSAETFIYGKGYKQESGHFFSLVNQVPDRKQEQACFDRSRKCQGSFTIKVENKRGKSTPEHDVKLYVSPMQ